MERLFYAKTYLGTKHGLVRPGEVFEADFDDERAEKLLRRGAISIAEIDDDPAVLVCEDADEDYSENSEAEEAEENEDAEEPVMAIDAAAGIGEASKTRSTKKGKSK